MKKVKSELEAIFGPEPKFDSKVIVEKKYNSTMTPLLLWYGNYGGAPNDKSLDNLHRQWLKDWATANDIKSNTYTIPKEGISTAAATARISTLGFPLNERNVAFLKDKFVSWKSEEKADVILKGKSPVINLADEEKLTPFVTLFDNAIDAVVDGATKWKVKSPGSLSGVHGNELKAMYKNGLKELKILYSGKDAEVTEAYALGKVKVRRLLRLYQDIINVIDDSMRLKKVTCKPRSKKVRMASDIVKKLKYAPSNAEFNLVSFDPVRLIKAGVVYTFDTRKRILKQFTGIDSSSIEIKGQTLKNCSVIQKKIRKPKEQLINFVNSSRLQCEKAFDAIKAKANETAPRINANMILLKVF